MKNQRIYSNILDLDSNVNTWEHRRIKEITDYIVECEKKIDLLTNLLKENQKLIKSLQAERDYLQECFQKQS